jgi:hypothetical protein
MTVHSEVCQVVLRALEHAIAHELASEHPVSTLTRDVINPVHSRKELTSQKPHPACRLGNPGSKHCTVLIPVARKEVIM